MTDDIDIELLRDKPTLFAERLSEFLTAEQVEQVVVVISEVCNYCWDSEQSCQCWNDE